MAAIAIIILLLLLVSVLVGALLVHMVVTNTIISSLFHYPGHCSSSASDSDSDNKPAPIYDEVELASSKETQHACEDSLPTDNVDLQKNMAYGELRMVQVVT